MDILNLKSVEDNVTDDDSPTKYQPVTVSMKVTMPRVYMEAFLGFLQHITRCGNAGESQWVGYYIDGQTNHPQIQVSRTNVKCAGYTRSAFTCDKGFDYND